MKKQKTVKAAKSAKKQTKRKVTFISKDGDSYRARITINGQRISKNHNLLRDAKEWVSFMQLTSNITA